MVRRQPTRMSNLRTASLGDRKNDTAARTDIDITWKQYKNSCWDLWCLTPRTLSYSVGLKSTNQYQPTNQPINTINQSINQRLDNSNCFLKSWVLTSTVKRWDLNPDSWGNVSSIVEDGEGGLQSPAWFPLVGLFEEWWRNNVTIWWFQPIWKIWVKLDHETPIFGMKMKTKYLKLPPPMWRSGCSESEASPFFVEIAADSESWLKIRVFLCSKSPHANPGSSKHLYESQAWIKNFKKCWTVFSLRCFCFLHW